MVPGPHFRIGVAFPQTEIGTDPFVIRDFAQAIEGMGYSHLVAADHVVGADVANRTQWSMPYTVESIFHEPLILFSYLAGVTRTLEFLTGVIVLPQRQTVLFAKQAANLDILCEGRLRIGLGVGWNEVEYEALGANFRSRGPLLDDQIRLLRRLWTERSLSDHGRFHHISEAGINPLPVQRPIPILVGGVSDAALKRAAHLGDGWYPSFESDVAEAKIKEFHQAVEEAGRDPKVVTVENHMMLGTTMGGPVRNIDEALKATNVWRSAGASGVAYHTRGMHFPGIDGHIGFLRRLAGMLDLAEGPSAEAAAPGDGPSSPEGRLTD